MTRKLNGILLVFLILVGGPFYWLLLDATTTGDAAKPVSIEQLRRLALAIPGPLPQAVRYEVIGRRPTTGDMIAAGSGLRAVPLVIHAYLLVPANGKTIAIDRGLSRSAAERSRIEDFDARAQTAVDCAIGRAALTLTLGPGVDHTGRTRVAPDFGSGAPPSRAITPRSEPYAVAPGVVVIPTYDIAPGERMVYARLASGQELLWAGDAAPLLKSWMQLRPPARIVTYFGDRDRQQIAGWLRTIHTLKSEAPELRIVAGHDSAVPGVIGKGFVPQVGRIRHDARSQQAASGQCLQDKRLALH